VSTPSPSGLSGVRVLAGRKKPLIILYWSSLSRLSNLKLELRELRSHFLPWGQADAARIINGLAGSLDTQDTLDRATSNGHFLASTLGGRGWTAWTQILDHVGGVISLGAGPIFII
jgi:hypothetical protein